VVFDFRLGGGRERPKRFLGPYRTGKRHVAHKCVLSWRNIQPRRQAARPRIKQGWQWGQRERRSKKRRSLTQRDLTQQAKVSRNEWETSRAEQASNSNLEALHWAAEAMSTTPLESYVRAASQQLEVSGC